MRVGVTGHRRLPPTTAALVARELRRCIGRWAAVGVVGLTCLADGADQLFAEAVLAAGGAIEVILPARRHALPADSCRAHDRLVRLAHLVECLAYDMPTPIWPPAGSSPIAATACWPFGTGAPARGLGGTADVVAYAVMRAVPVEIVWPPGAWRPGN